MSSPCLGMLFPPAYILKITLPLDLGSTAKFPSKEPLPPD